MKKKRRILLSILVALLFGATGTAYAAPAVTFKVTDEPGSWFECKNTGATTSSIVAGCANGPTVGNSLAVIAPNDKIAFESAGEANTKHTAVSLIFPHAATGMPFDVDLDPQKLGVGGSHFEVQLVDPGLYVFYCDIHPYMFATVIVDDPATAGTLDLGTSVDLPSVLGITNLPTATDLVLQLVHTFFKITNPNMWQQYALVATTWNTAYPGVPVSASTDGTTYGVSITDLDVFLRQYFHEGGTGTVFPTDCPAATAAVNGTECPRKVLAAPVHPSHAGVGQVWIDTQFEKMAEKNKPGTATMISAADWKVHKKVGLPDINMNNPHNMWTNRAQTLIFQTEWFDDKLTVFNRQTGALVRQQEVGPAPAHVMTRTDTDQVHVSLNAANSVVELTPNAKLIERDILVGDFGADTHPHAHWMSADGKMMVTPNVDTEDSTLYDFTSDQIADREPVGHFPIATGMMPDSSKYYVANFLDSTLSVITITPGTPPQLGTTPTTTINLLANYDPVTLGGVPTGPIGVLPIQTPVSPDGKYVITANTLSGTIIVIDTITDTIVKQLTCDAGCHGVQFGAKKGGGYYAYVSSKFSNRLIVVDLDGTATGPGAVSCIPGSPCIAGSVLLTKANHSALGYHQDGHPSQYEGMGGQGVLPIPLVYNGWVQHLPNSWKLQLTAKQRTATP